MVFQNYALYPHMTVRQNMAFGLKLRKYSKQEIADRVKEAADILGIGELLDRNAIDMLKPDATVLGRITEFKRVAAMAAGKRVPLYPHWMHHLHASLVAAIPMR